MKARELKEGIHWVGAIDWDRRIFDSLIPIPEGTSYNAYLVRGTEKTVLIDTVEAGFAGEFFARLDSLGVTRIDFVVANHAEQDHTGSLPLVLERFPDARVLATKRARKMIPDLVPVPEDRIDEVADGDTLPLGGGRTLRFVHFPWVHWPETMLTYAVEDRILFPCDLFGSHLATNRLIWDDDPRLISAAKLYYAEIMMPFRRTIAKRLPAVADLPIDLIAPSHGPVYGRPAGVLRAYEGWVSDAVENRVVLPFISMHESTRIMVDFFIDALTDRGVEVDRFSVETVDLGRLSTALVDAATVVFGTPTVLGGPHPNVIYAAHLVAALQPKARRYGVIGSYGWAGKAAQAILGVLEGLKATTLEPVTARGTPGPGERTALERLAGEIARLHREEDSPAGA